MKVSIAIATFNRRESVLFAVSSVVQQDLVESEVILVDDASDERIPENELDARNGCKTRAFVHHSNKGLASSRNTAIRAARGEYFSFCDDDDRWPPDLASRLVAAMDSAPADVGMAVAMSESRKGDCSDLLEGYPRLTELMKAGLTPPVGSQIYRTELLRRVGGYRPEVTSGVDHDLWVSLARIDPRVAVAWGEPAIVGRSPSRERMTTVEHRRRAGIAKSLVIWRQDLCEVFGEDFYHHFVRSYQRYLDYNFFLKSIHRRDYLDTAVRAVRAPWLPFEVLRRRWNRVRGHPQCTLFPKFDGE